MDERLDRIERSLERLQNVQRQIVDALRSWVLKDEELLEMEDRVIPHSTRSILKAL